MKKKRKKYVPLAEKFISQSTVKVTKTLQEIKEYIESITKNDTCHRPDISCYGVCDYCPMTEYCLCSLNTKNNRKRYKRMLKEA